MPVIKDTSIKVERRTKAAQREETMQALIALGRAMFTEYGYANTPMEELVARAGITRGALYHHFGSKEGFFRAVFDAVQTTIGQRIEVATANIDDDWDQLVVGCRVFLSASLDPEVQRIVLIDAPAVLEWEVWRKADADGAMASLHAVLETLEAQGILRVGSVEALTHLLSGAMNEAALWIARSPDPEQALEQSGKALEQMLEAFRVSAR